jgi:hypothetical protein
MRNQRVSLSVFALLILLSPTAAPGSGLNPLASDRQTSLKALQIRDIARAEAYRELSRRQGPAGPVRPATGASLQADKDDDGMPDSWEKAHGFNPDDPNDAWLDPDNDRVVNVFEYLLGGNPKSAASPPVVTVGKAGLADYSSLDDALDKSVAGSVIRVAKGVYKTNYKTFSPKSVMIQGGWSPDFLTRNLKRYPVTLDGANRDEVLYFSASSGACGIALDGLKVIRGKGYFGALNFLAQSTAVMRVGVFNCLVLQSGVESSASYGAVVRFNNWDKSLSDRTVANSVIAGNMASGIYAQVTEYAKARWRILHTVIAGNENGNGENGFGIEAFTLNSGRLSGHIYNGVIRDNEREDICFSRSITFAVDHLDLGRYLAEYGAVLDEGDVILDVDPGFMDPAHDNYHFKSGSALVNKGTKQGIPLIDFEGDKRVKGAAPDMGPDER